MAWGGGEHRVRHQEVAEKIFSKVLKRSRIFRFCGHCILKNTDLSTACYSNMGQNMGQIVWYQIALNYSELLNLKTKEKVPKSYDFRTFYGCGGRTRTYDRGCKVKPRFLLWIPLVMRPEGKCHTGQFPSCR